MCRKANVIGWFSLLTLFSGAEAGAQISNAPPSCPKEVYKEPQEPWLCFTADVRADHRTRSDRGLAVAEPDRTQDGPQLSIYRARLADERPISRSLFEVRLFGDYQSSTGVGEFRTSVGLRAQLESPPRRPGDPHSSFNRHGRRLRLERVGVSLGGFSAGYLPSAFYFTPSLSYTTGYATEQSTTLVSYTVHPTAKWAVTLSFEDPKPRRIIDPAWGEYRSAFTIDPIVSVNRSFSWGTARVAAAAHPVRGRSHWQCCAPAQGSALGWAAMAGVEAWKDWSFGSSELLLNVSASKGALDYLNATDHPADFAVRADGKVDLTGGVAGVASVGHYWTPKMRTVLSLSAVRTELQTDQFKLQVDGRIAQASAEYMLHKNLIAGVEFGYHHDRLRDPTFASGAACAGHVSLVAFMRKRFRTRVGR